GRVSIQLDSCTELLFGVVSSGKVRINKAQIDASIGKIRNFAHDIRKVSYRKFGMLLADFVEPLPIFLNERVGVLGFLVGNRVTHGIRDEKNVQAYEFGGAPSNSFRISGPYRSPGFTKA